MIHAGLEAVANFLAMSTDDPMNQRYPAQARWAALTACTSTTSPSRTSQCLTRFGQGSSAKDDREPGKSGPARYPCRPTEERCRHRSDSTTTQRAGQGLAARMSYVFDGVRELFELLADKRINEVDAGVGGRTRRNRPATGACNWDACTCSSRTESDVRRRTPASAPSRAERRRKTWCSRDPPGDGSLEAKTRGTECPYREIPARISRCLFHDGPDPGAAGQTAGGLVASAG